MRRRGRSHVVKALVVVAAVGILAATALAVWSSNASGSGNTKAVTAETVTVNAITGTADLYPGGPAGKVYFTLTNTNPYSITFDSLTGALVTDVSGGSGGTPSCATTDVTVSTLPASGLALTVGANTTSATRSISGVVSMVGAAPDACQGAVFTVSLTLTGSQT